MHTIFSARRLYPAALVFVTRIFTVAMIVLLVLGFGPMGHTLAAGKMVRITLIDENGSGEDGSAQITDQENDTTKIELTMLNEPDGITQSAGISEGSCATIDPDVATAYPLEAVTAAKSTSIVNISLDELMAKKYSILVYKSASDKTIIACGDLPTAASASTTPVATAVPASTVSTLDSAFKELDNEAGDLVRETTNQDATGAQAAYDEFHTTFAANEDAIKAKDAASQAKIEDAMHEVRDAITAKNFVKAATAAKELQDVVSEARDAVASGTTSSSLPTTGADDWLMLSLELALGALLLVGAGVAVRRPTSR